MSTPSISTEPHAGATRPVLTRATVVLPAPFGPSTETTLPFGTVSDTSKIALNGPYPASTFRSSSIVGAGAPAPGPAVAV